MRAKLAIGPGFAQVKDGGDPLPFDTEAVHAAILTIEWDEGADDMSVTDVKLVERRAQA